MSILSTEWARGVVHNVHMPSNVSRLRFAFPTSPVSPSLPALPGRSPASGANALDMSRAEGFALLSWLGLGQPEFGAIKARELAPLCRRRLWPVQRNAQPRLRELTRALLTVAEAAGEGMVLFG